MGSEVTTLLPTVHSLGRARATGADEKTALRAFDAWFVGELLRRSAPDEPTGLLDGGQAGRMYQDHLYQELGRIIAENTDFGLARTLEGRLGGAPATSPSDAEPVPKGAEEDR